MIVLQEIIAFDLDGTLAYYDHWRGKDHIGKPIEPMVNKLKEYLNQRKKCIIFTARTETEPVKKWVKDVVGKILPVTNIKDPKIEKFYDDRAIAVEKNTGKILGGE